jgi:DNA-binding XRE family transcriptional regulator
VYKRQVVTRLERDPARAAALEEARRSIAARHYRDSQGLAELRLRKGWSQRRLAEAIGVKQPHIARLESGQNEPSLGTVRKLAAALGATVEEIVNAFGGQD